MPSHPSWNVEGRDWPHRHASRFVTVDGVCWHLQEMGEGPTILLLHGAGAATHSWRGLAPLLAKGFRIIAPDLSGHGFTGVPRAALSLPTMAGQTTALLKSLDIVPALVVGHSAGAAIAIRMALDGRLPGVPIVAVNGALQPFAGITAPLFQGLAFALFANPLAVRVFTGAARDPARVARVIRGTGSHIDREGLDFYARLFRNPGHVASTLGMMANWDLEALRRDFGRLRSPLTLVVGSNDAAVPPSVAEQVRASIPHAEIVTLNGVGHLAHEERPDLVAAVVEQVARTNALFPENAA